MAIKKIVLKNFTVFADLSLELSPGINVFIGENGFGKTHIMKLIYAACKAVRSDISFPYKAVKVFDPLEHAISRLVNRRASFKKASAQITAEDTLSMDFSKETKKWDAKITGEDAWKEQMHDLICTFIPAKEILSNAWNLEAAVFDGNVDFDDTYVDILVAAKIKKVSLRKKHDTSDREKYLKILQKITNGSVVFEKDRFFLQPDGDKERVEFSLVAEGIRKIALLWQLINNGALEKGSILLWDEPEANLNPVHIPMIAEMLLELQRNGVQIFVATHDYFLAKYLGIKSDENDQILFHSLYKPAEDSEGGVLAESKEGFIDLEHNAISDTFIKLYKDEIEKAMK